MENLFLIIKKSIKEHSLLEKIKHDNDLIFDFNVQTLFKIPNNQDCISIKIISDKLEKKHINHILIIENIGNSEYTYFQIFNQLSPYSDLMYADGYGELLVSLKEATNKIKETLIDVNNKLYLTIYEELKIDSIFDMV
jgi:hypothetical protein